MSTLYPPNYRKKDPREFLYHYPSYAEPVKLSKSFSNFLYYSTLHLMESVAAHQEKIVVPFECFSWKRIRKLKDMNTFHFKVGGETYFVISEIDLKAIEKNKLEEYMSKLKWNSEYHSWKYK